MYSLKVDFYQRCKETQILETVSQVTFLKAIQVTHCFLLVIFFDEMMEKEKCFIKRWGGFIVPLPRPKFIEP